MDRDHFTTGNHQLRTAVFGMIVLALGMGIGRFLYTSMLPVMLEEGIFSFKQLSWIASANYAGYLAGSLLFSFYVFQHLTRLRTMVLSAAVVTSLLILAMAVFNQVAIVILVRFMAGVASAGMMIFGSMLVLQNTHNPSVIASLFAGVGAGIFIGNEYVIAGLAFALSAKTLWLGAALISTVLLVLLILFLPSNAHMLLPPQRSNATSQLMPWWQLALLYGLAGFGYIIVATYLPLVAKGLAMPMLTQHLWSIVGLAIIPGCYGWLAAGRHWGILPSLSANLVIQGTCVVLTLFSHSPLLLTLSCIGFGATFMGTTSLVMSFAKQLRAPKKINLLGVVTLTYGTGQIAGPLLTSALHSGSNAVTIATLYGAASLFIAAGISQFQSYKNKC